MRFIQLTHRADEQGPEREIWIEQDNVETITRVKNFEFSWLTLKTGKRLPVSELPDTILALLGEGQQAQGGEGDESITKNMESLTALYPDPFRRLYEIAWGAYHYPNSPSTWRNALYEALVEVYKKQAIPKEHAPPEPCKVDGVLQLAKELMEQMEYVDPNFFNEDYWSATKDRMMARKAHALKSALSGTIAREGE